jgi:DNA mismatch repair protein MutS2
VAIRAFVDDATRAGLSEWRVVHGRGTGALRAAARDELARHRLVSGRSPTPATAPRSSGSLE